MMNMIADMFATIAPPPGDGSAALALTALWWAAVSVAVLHTLAGPDHYLPFIAIAKSRGYSMGKTLLWTLFCGLGHVGSALLLAVGFVWFSHWLAQERYEWLENNRGDLAAYSLIGLGTAYILWSLRHRLQHRKGLAHHHAFGLGHASSGREPNGKASITVWVMFIIFVLGPCEALLPVLMSASVLGMSAVISATLLFSTATIGAMLFMVAAGMLGLRYVKVPFLQRYAHETAGFAILLCGLLILCGL